jgi:uridine kinase
MREATSAALESLINHIAEHCATRSPYVVGIDGCGGAGKSSLARTLAAEFDAQLVQMDDFYRPSEERQAVALGYGEDFDWRRLRDEVLQPLREGLPSVYRRYDWDLDRLSPNAVGLHPAGIVIAEGVYVTRLDLAPYLDLQIWVDCPYTMRLERGVARDGADARDRWVNDWMIQEARYLDAEHPELRADFRVSGF